MTIYLNAVLSAGQIALIDGSGHAITISGDSGNNGSRDVQIFNISANALVNLSHLSLVSGTANLGGAIYNAGTLSLTAVSLQNNAANANGGALYNVGSVTIYTSSITYNHTQYDGAIYNAGVLTLKSSTLANNTQPYGGLHNASSGVANITNSTFANNSSSQGGGILNRGVLSVTNSSFANNSGYASGIYNQSGSLHLINSVITGSCINQATLATNLNNLIDSGNCNPAYAGSPISPAWVSMAGLRRAQETRCKPLRSCPVAQRLITATQPIARQPTNAVSPVLALATSVPLNRKASTCSMPAGSEQSTRCWVSFCHAAGGDDHCQRRQRTGRTRRQRDLYRTRQWCQRDSSHPQRQHHAIQCQSST